MTRSLIPYSSRNRHAHMRYRSGHASSARHLEGDVRHPKDCTLSGDEDISCVVSVEGWYVMVIGMRDLTEYHHYQGSSTSGSFALDIRILGY